MRRISFRRPSPALVLAGIALGVALSGTSYATVLNVPRNSVGTPQLRNSAVTARKLAPNAVTTATVRNRSLLRVRLRPRSDAGRAHRASGSRRAGRARRTSRRPGDEPGRASRVHVDVELDESEDRADGMSDR